MTNTETAKLTRTLTGTVTSDKIVPALSKYRLSMLVIMASWT